MSLHPTFVEYMDGARLYLEMDTDKENASLREVKIHFCDFIRKMIKNFSCKLPDDSMFVCLFAVIDYENYGNEEKKEEEKEDEEDQRRLTNQTLDCIN